MELLEATKKLLEKGMGGIKFPQEKRIFKEKIYQGPGFAYNCKD